MSYGAALQPAITNLSQRVADPKPTAPPSLLYLNACELPCLWGCVCDSALKLGGPGAGFQVSIQTSNPISDNWLFSLILLKAFFWCFD